MLAILAHLSTDSGSLERRQRYASRANCW
jgi:hypothetical protein